MVTVTIICNGLYPFPQNAVDEIEMATANNSTADNERTVQLMTFSQTTRVPQGRDKTVADYGSSDYIEIIEYATPPSNAILGSSKRTREHSKNHRKRCIWTSCSRNNFITSRERRSNYSCHKSVKR